MQELLTQIRDMQGRVTKLQDRAHKLGSTAVKTPEKLPATGLEKWSPSILGSGELRKLFDDKIDGGFFYLPNEKRKNPIGDHIPWDDKYIKMRRVKVWKGEEYDEYTGPNAGIYHMGRGTSKVVYTTLQAFRATKDLRILDVACGEAYSLVLTAKDESGINSTEPDGYLGLAYGVNGHRQIFFGPNDPRNTARISDGEIEYANAAKRGNSSLKQMTGTEQALDEALWFSVMAAAKDAYDNRNKFSPTYESGKDRPSKPEYYRAVYKAILKLYEDTQKKWAEYFKDRIESELPLVVNRSLVHPALNDIVALVDHAGIVGGADWQRHDSYKRAERAWEMIFGDAERVGAQKNPHLAMWHIANHPRWGKCLIYAHRAKRFEPDGEARKDSTGEYPTRNLGKQYCHPNDYMSDDIGAQIHLHERKCGFVTREHLAMLGNTVLATMTIGNKFERNGRPTPVPYGMHGNEMVPELSSPWGQGKSLHGSSTGLLTGSTLAGLSAYTEHPEAFDELIRGAMEDFTEPTDQTYGAWAGLMLGAAKREGRI